MHNDGKGHNSVLKTWLLISPHYDKLCLKDENSRQLLLSHYSKKSHHGYCIETSKLHS